MKPLSNSRRRNQMSPGCLVLFFVPFLAIGCFASYFVLWRPWSTWISARFWQPVTCRVVSSQVASSSDGDTYRVDIAYTWTVDGQEFRGSRYDFMGGSSSGYDGKAAIVAQHPPGSRTTCWVDPAHPDSAVFSRDLSWMYLFGLFPLIFVAAGAGGIVWAFRTARKYRRSKDVDAAQAALGLRPSPFGVEIPADAAQPKVLRPLLAAFGKLVGLILVALFWNGIVSAFVIAMVVKWREGKAPEGCLVAFLVPFVLIGLGLIVAVFRQFLVLFNPRLEMTLSQGVLVLGQSALLQWKIEGKVERVKRLRIFLEGREQATYRRGTDIVTDRQVFATIPILETDQPMQIAQGSANVSVPDETAPSFSADHNKIIWTLKATCDIPGWPDSEDEYDLVVAPATMMR
ncbi:MAG TPA: DUF3592 domain-containing protein [Thermoanaerobaculia bacterium]|nr:DUF3592 domain-containing protein [Thermoanaerobaculia bacterium]